MNKTRDDDLLERIEQVFALLMRRLVQTRRTIELDRKDAALASIDELTDTCVHMSTTLTALHESKRKHHDT